MDNEVDDDGDGVTGGDDNDNDYDGDDDDDGDGDGAMGSGGRDTTPLSNGPAYSCCRGNDTKLSA
jgi:hypothetical protein